MSSSTSRLLLLGGAALTALALSACTPPYGDRDVTGTPSPEPEISISPEKPDSSGGATRPTDSPDLNGGGEATDDGALGETTIGMPAGVDASAAADASVGLGWSSDGATLYVTTFGSSSCPRVPSDLTAAAGEMTIDLTTAGGAVCTADYVASTTAIPTPAAVPSDVAYTVTVSDAGTDLGTAELAPAADPIAFAWIAAPAG